MKKKTPGGGGRRGGNPPEEHRWKPGQSGNPGGRPKKVPTMRERARDLMSEKIDAEVSLAEMTVGDRYLRHLISGTVKDPAAAIRFMQWLEGHEPPAAFLDVAEPFETQASESDLDIIRDALEREMRRQSRTRGKAAGSKRQDDEANGDE